MAYTDRLTLIVPTGVLANSSEVFTVLDPDSGGAATFSVPLSADGLAPATHYAAYSPLEVATYDALVNLNAQDFKDYVNVLAGERGRQGINSALAFKNSLLIEDANAPVGFHAFIAANGLQLAEVI